MDLNMARSVMLGGVLAFAATAPALGMDTIVVAEGRYGYDPDLALLVVAMTGDQVQMHWDEATMGVEAGQLFTFAEPQEIIVTGTEYAATDSGGQQVAVYFSSLPLARLTTEQPVFFTNSVMGLKPPPMSSNFKDKWLRESREEFLAPLLSIIQPNVVITMGAKPTLTIGRIYDFPVGKHVDMVNAGGVRTKAGPVVVPVYHTGGYGLISRPRMQQEQDWLRVKAYL